MPGRIRYHLDENVNPEIADGLRNRAVDVTTTNQVGLRTTKDPTQFEFSRREGRVIIPHDKDFLRIAAKEFDHPGIVYCRSSSHSIGHIVLSCLELYDYYDAEDLRGRVEYL